MTVKKSSIGFAGLSKEQRIKIASMGGKSVLPENRSFSRDRELAVKAGMKGGTNVPKEKRSYYRDQKLATRSGKLGGIVRKEKRLKENKS